MTFFSELFSLRNTSVSTFFLKHVPVEVVPGREGASTSGHLGFFRVTLYEQTGEGSWGRVAAFRSREPSSLDLRGFTFHDTDWSKQEGRWE